MIYIPGNPVSVNHAYRHSRFGVVMDREASSWKETVQRAAMCDWKGPPIAGSAKVVMRIYFADRRRRDIDNALKLILDGLSGRCYDDDRQIDELHVFRCYDKKKPRVEVEVTALETNPK